MQDKIEDIEKLHKLYLADAITKLEFEILKEEIIGGVNPLEENNTKDVSKSSLIQIGEGATDIDGNKYKSLIIGEQEWMVENLRTSRYGDGTLIPNVTEDYEWENLSKGAWYHYNNDIRYESIYGKLYNWYAVETGKLCPKGWHVPTDDEWTVLEDYLEANGHSGKEGKALKSVSGWQDKEDGTSGNGTDDYGWNGLPGGVRYDDGSFGSVGQQGYWWSSSQFNAGFAWYRYLYYDFDGVHRSATNKLYGFSVRCLRD